MPSRPVRGARKYPMIVRSWRTAWEQVVPFFAFSQPIRRAIYTINAIESLNSTVRRAVRTRGHFPERPGGHQTDLPGATRGAARLARSATVLAAGAHRVRDPLRRALRGGVVTGRRPSSAHADPQPGDRGTPAYSVDGEPGQQPVPNLPDSPQPLDRPDPRSSKEDPLSTRILLAVIPAAVVALAGWLAVVFALPKPPRIRQAFRNLRRDTRPSESAFRVVLCWLANDDTGEDGRRVELMFCGMDGFAPERSARVVGLRCRWLAPTNGAVHAPRSQPLERRLGHRRRSSGVGRSSPAVVRSTPRTRNAPSWRQSTLQTR